MAPCIADSLSLSERTKLGCYLEMEQLRKSQDYTGRKYTHHVTPEDF